MPNKPTFSLYNKYHLFTRKKWRVQNDLSHEISFINLWSDEYRYKWDVFVHFRVNIWYLVYFIDLDRMRKTINIPRIGQTYISAYLISDTSSQLYMSPILISYQWPHLRYQRFWTRFGPNHSDRRFEIDSISWFETFRPIDGIWIVNFNPIIRENDTTYSQTRRRTYPLVIETHVIVTWSRFYPKSFDFVVKSPLNSSNSKIGRMLHGG